MRRFNIGKWFIEYKLDPEYGEHSRVVVLNCDWPREKGQRFGYFNDWYDGPHKAIIVGPINLYWNW